MAKQRLVPYVHIDGKVWEFFYVDPASEVIYFRKSHLGKKIKFSTHVKVPDGIKAKRFANAEFERRIGRKTKHVRTLIGEELDSWLALKESEGLADSTLYVVRRSKKYIDEFWRLKLPNEINRDTFAEWVAWWRENKSDIEMEQSIKYFNNFCRYLHEKVVNDRPLLPTRISFPRQIVVLLLNSRELLNTRLQTAPGR